MGSTRIETHRERLPDYHFSPSFLAGELRFAERYRAAHDGELPSTPFWRYIEERHALDPARFDHWHPLIGRWIEHQPQLLPPPSGGGSGGSTPPGGGTGIPILPPPDNGGGSSTTPEPASWVLLAVAMVVLGIFGRRR